MLAFKNVSPGLSIDGYVPKVHAQARWLASVGRAAVVAFSSNWREFRRAAGIDAIKYSLLHWGFRRTCTTGDMPINNFTMKI